MLNKGRHTLSNYAEKMLIEFRKRITGVRKRRGWTIFIGRLPHKKGYSQMMKTVVPVLFSGS